MTLFDWLFSAYGGLARGSFAVSKLGNKRKWPCIEQHLPNRRGLFTHMSYDTSNGYDVGRGHQAHALQLETDMGNQPHLGAGAACLTHITRRAS